MMITLDRLKEVDPSFHVHSTKEMTGALTTLCSLDHFHKGGVIFIKDKKFYQKLLALSVAGSANGDSLKDIGVIFRRQRDTVLNCGESSIVSRFEFDLRKGAL